MNSDLKVINFSDTEIIKKTRIHINSNIFLICLYIISILILKFSPTLTCENNNEGPNFHGCGMTNFQFIILVILFILFILSILDGISGITLARELEKKKTIDVKVLKYSSYILLVPVIIVIIFWFI